MKVEIKIPTLGESISEATIGTILKPSGSFVQTDEEILELETDKVNQVLSAPQAGELTLSVNTGDSVAIGQVIGFLDTEVKNTALLPPKPAVAPPKAPPPVQVKVIREDADKKSSPPPVASVQARITQDDFIRSMKKTPPPPPVSSDKVPTRKKMSALRKVIASRLVEVKNATAMLTTFNEIDMWSVMHIRAKEKEAFVKKHGVKLGFMSFFVKGVVAALKAYPQLNVSLDKDEIVTYHTYDIGIAVSTERGLMVPVVRGCEDLIFAEIEKALETYAKKAREGGIAVDDLKGGSFTITNGGTFGSLLSTPLLNPPQSAILGMHAIVKRPVVVDDAIVIRPMMYVALSYDHRLIDGKEAVLFLVHLKNTLENPSHLLLDL